MKILIVGGYGTFGRRLVELLSSQSQLTLIVAGRSIKLAEDLSNKFINRPAKVKSSFFDRESMNIENDLKSLKPDLLVDASGPFQYYSKDPYRLIRICLRTSINYVDLADGSQFVKGVSQFDNEAKSKNMFVISGLSTCPALTTAVIRHLSKDLIKIETVKGGIAPTPYVDIGLNVIRAITSYSGKSICLEKSLNKTLIGYAMTDTMRYTISPPGYVPLLNRRFSLVDVPDYEILTDLFPTINSLWFGAGTIPELSHRILNLFSWLVRLKILSTLKPFSSFFHFSSKFFRWGEDRGGLFISIEGLDQYQQKHEKSWHLIAEHDSGPFIPLMGIQAIIVNILNGKMPKSGARCATEDLQLNDFENLFKNYSIVTGQRNSSLDRKRPNSASLYEELLDSSWNKLPQSIKILHNQNTIKAKGFAKVEQGKNPLAKLLIKLFRFPESGENLPIEVTFQRNSNGELWIRNFQGKSFSSLQSKGYGKSDKLLLEHFGPFTFALALLVKQDQLHLIVRNWFFFGIPLPRILAPFGNFYEFDSNGIFHFYVEINSRFIGLIVKYQGCLIPFYS